MSNVVPHGFDSVPESIRRVLERRITEGGLQPGDRLGLKSEIQREFGVAGPTIDQALKLLANDGLITIRRGPGGGVFVARSHPVLRLGTKQLWARDARTLAENVELREALTSLLGVSAARSTERDPDTLAQLKRVLTDLKQTPLSSEYQRLIWRGHHLLVDLCDSATLGFLYRNLLDAAQSLIVQVDLPDEGPELDQERTRVDAHIALFRAVLDGDIDGAQRAGQVVRSVSPLGRDRHHVTARDAPSR